MQGKYVIGLTGNIATGKSLVLRMLKELGAYTIDADDLVHVLMRRGGPLYDRIVAEFGREILDEDGQIDRRKLGNIVFADRQALAHLERITHPIVIQTAQELIARALANIVAVEAIKLIESGMADQYDAIWVVTANKEAQLSRLMSKRKLSEAQARLRIEAQPPQEEKVRRAQVVIDNSGDVLETWKAVQRHFAAVQRAAAAAQTSRPTAEAAAPSAPGMAAPAPQIRRARRADLEAMARLWAHAMRVPIVPTAADMMERFFSKGYFVACAGQQLLGMVGLRAENLIATVDDCIVYSAELWPEVGQALLEVVEREARHLSCEVILLFAHQDSKAEAIETFEKNGYRKTSTSDLPRMWRQAAEEYLSQGAILWVKKLLERQIMKPI